MKQRDPFGLAIPDVSSFTQETMMRESVLVVALLLVSVAPVLAIGSADFDADGAVDVPDVAFFLAQWKAAHGGQAWDERADLDGDGTLGVGDARLLMEQGLTGVIPVSWPPEVIGTSIARNPVDDVDEKITISANGTLIRQTPSQDPTVTTKYYLQSKTGDTYSISETPAGAGDIGVQFQALGGPMLDVTWKYPDRTVSVPYTLTNPRGGPTPWARVWIDGAWYSATSEWEVWSKHYVDSVSGAGWVGLHIYFSPPELGELGPCWIDCVAPTTWNPKIYDETDFTLGNLANTATGQGRLEVYASWLPGQDYDSGPPVLGVMHMARQSSDWLAGATTEKIAISRYQRSKVDGVWVLTPLASALIYLEFGCWYDRRPGPD